MTPVAAPQWRRHVQAHASLTEPGPGREMLPCLVQALSALCLDDLAARHSCGEHWYLSPRRAAQLLGCTSDSLGSFDQPLTAWHQAGGPRWVELEQACWRYLLSGGDALLAGKGKGARQDAWLRLRPAACQPGHLEDVLRRALDGQLYVPLRAPVRPAERSEKKKRPTTAIPLLDPHARSESAKAPEALATKRPEATKATKVVTTLAPRPLPRRFLSIDCETTGFSHKKHRVWEVAVALFEDGHLVWTHCRRVNPRQYVPREVVELTGVDPVSLQDEPGFESIAGKLFELLEGEVVVAHNLPFDKRMLKAEFERAGLAWPQTDEEICTEREVRPLMTPLGKKTKLDICCDHFGIELTGHHQAADDAVACGKLLLALRGGAPTGDGKARRGRG